MFSKILPRARSYQSQPSLQNPIANFKKLGSFFFSPLSRRDCQCPPIHAYPLGPTLSLNYVQDKQTEITASKLALKKILECHSNQHPDLNNFVELLFDFTESARILKKIDAQTQKIMQEVDPDLFSQFEKALIEGNHANLLIFFKDHFLPSLRTIFKTLARHYGFDPGLIETNDGLLLDDDYIDFVKQGKLCLDLGEDGHGPLSHLVAAFMMKELEIEGQINCALTLYQSLAECCNFYCPDRMNFAYRFLLLLDYPSCYPLTEGLFCNPASLANHLLFHGDCLGQLSMICKNHAKLLCEISQAEWHERENKILMSKGKALLS